MNGQLHTPAARRAQAASRAANIAGTRRTTRPGSEDTSLEVGDRVRVARATGCSGTWSTYDGRNGYVATVNRQTFPDRTAYVEVGVTWFRYTDPAKAAADAWFRTDELELEEALS